MPRITDSTKNLAQLNRQLDQVEKLRKDNELQKQQIAQLNNTVNQFDLARQVERTNNITVTWTGGTLTLSWPAGYTRDKDGNVTRILAGSRVVIASTVYWFAWNDFHNTMAIDSNLQNVNTKARNIVLFSVKTGTAGQAGTAGGGGSAPGGTDKNAVSYVNF